MISSKLQRVTRDSMKFLTLPQIWWRSSTAATLYLILVLQLQVFETGECSRRRPEAWTSAASGTLVSESPLSTVELCPLNFDKLSHYPWVAKTCQQWPPDEYLNSTLCCNAVVSAIWLAEAQLLNETNMYRLPDMGAVDSCLRLLQRKLESQGLTHKAVDQCFPESLSPRFLTNNSLCLGITTGSDFEKLIGKDNITELRRVCAGDLTDPLACNTCQTETIGVYNILNRYPRNSTEVGLAYEKLIGNITIGSNLDGRLAPDCFYDVLLYTAAKATTSGPWSESTAECVLDMGLIEKHREVVTAMDMLLISIASSLCASLLGWLIVAFLIMCERQRSITAETHHKNLRANKIIMLKPPAAQKEQTDHDIGDGGPIKYEHQDIQAATDNFSAENLIAEGGFGSVYKGVMENGLKVAVKRIMNNVPEEKDDGDDAEFWNEVEIINRIRHPNLMLLRGCCVTHDAEAGHQRLLVYDFMPNRSLERLLHQQEAEGNGSSSTFLSWANRVKIIVGIAKGLAYLHEDTQPCTIHADIKPGNILLDEELNVKLTNFGLACLNDGTHSKFLTTGRRGGTPGYVAPESALYGQFTEKSAVYSFGVVMLELLTGRKALDPAKESTPDYAVTDWSASMVQEGKVWEVVDERIRFVGPKEKMQTYVMIACTCTQKLVTLRPTFREVLKYLQGQLPVPTMMLPLQQYSFGSYDWSDVESFAASRRYLASDAADMTEFLR